jgi:L-threonylcarbamoyladenylate synthase
VYGLGADAADGAALARLYAVKGRPADHPSIVHLATADDARAWAARWPEPAEALAAAFWPGPLTLILPAGDRAHPAALGGTGTIGLRVPAVPLAREAIRASGTGIAAPSANRFGRVSPTTAAHVAADVGDDLDAILDGGPCAVGVESTIVDLTGDRPAILRPGAITAEAIAAVLGATPSTGRADAPRAPGTLASHYAPRLPVILAGDLAEAAAVAGRRAALIAPSTALAASTGVAGIVARLDAGDDAESYAARLYALLREADASGAEAILAIPPPPGGIGDAVRDRLRRAAG